MANTVIRFACEDYVSLTVFTFHAPNVVSATIIKRVRASARAELKQSMMLL